MTTLTAHAGRRSTQRAVTAREIALTLRHPDSVRRLSGRLMHLRGNCCVITDRTAQTVITVYHTD